MEVENCNSHRGNTPGARETGLQLLMVQQRSRRKRPGEIAHVPEEAADNGVDPPLLSEAALTSGFSFQPSLSAASGSRRHPVLQSFTTHMDYFLGIDVGSVNA
ncbi:MAG: hypothetical protein KAX25_05020, partial [Dehalococcoidia bacterium]|nr:hypothetical protein [Dehalococcoidia bacterium]